VSARKQKGQYDWEADETYSSRSSAKSLEAESGITLEHTSIVAFRKAVLSGDWKNAERLLIDGLKYGASRLAGTSRGSVSSADISTVLRDSHFGGLDVSLSVVCSYRTLFAHITYLPY
jgi:hypothetical protein